MTAERKIIETLFRIPDKEGRDVDFKLNAVQSKFDAELALRNIVPKARQRGLTSYTAALFCARCLAYRNRRAFILSHKADATQKILDRIHYYLEHIKGPKADLRYSSRNEIYFNKTDSVFHIGTAGSPGTGIGDTITDFHGSEVAFWEKPQELLKGIFNAITPTGTVILESTGKGMGNFFHRTVMRAAEGASRYKLHFFSWTDAPEYRIHLSEDEARSFAEGLDPELGESELLAQGILDLEQLAWRRDKIIEMDYDVQGFKEQYPLTLDECFQGTGASYFKRVRYEQSKLWHQSDVPYLWVYGDHPRPGLHYAAGMDSGGGTGRDNSTLEIFCVEEMRQVGEWASNRFEPHIFAQKCAPILVAFNNAYVNVERNNHGIITIEALLRHYNGGAMHMSRPPDSIIKEYGKLADYGTFTSVKNRFQIISSLRKLAVDELTIHSPLLKNEMDSFVESDTGKLEAQEGCLDDRVMASGMATYVFPKVMLRANITQKQLQDETEKDPFSLTSILSELDRRYTETPR